MFRTVCVILFLTAMGVGVVQLRRAQDASAAETYRLEAERLKVRRQLWAQQIELEAPMRPDSIGADEPAWALELAAPEAEPRRQYLARNN
ncbi:MAG TPA: hypothetical protein VFJ30_01300 [Phycisphaerae bacterium]|nr:hypothetical protein [Phycisphaerae bacterium]